MIFSFRFPRAFGACALALLLLDSASATAISDAMPTPGLYRIDTDGTIKAHPYGGAPLRNRIETDGKTGNTTATVSGPGQNPITRQYAGTGEQTYCMKSLAVVAPPTAGCVSPPGKITKDGMVMENKCGYLDATTTIRKIDDKTWEYTTKTVMRNQNQAQAMQDNAAGMRMMMENMAKNAATPEDREKARQALAQLPAMTAQLKQQQAQVDAMQPQIDAHRAEAESRGMVMPADNRTREIIGVQRWTRIADHCDAKGK